VGSERNIIVRAIPLFIKNPILRMNFKKMGYSQCTGVLSNFMGIHFLLP